jgi:hypothetical protein
MADIKRIKKGLKDAEDIANALVVVSTALAIFEPVINAAAKTVKEKVKERKDLVDIPELYSRGLPIKLERAIILLEECKLKVEPVAIRDANIKYKDCFDLQIVGSKPKHKQKVKPGTLVFLKYVTSEVIEESQKLFDKSEKYKAEVRLEKANKRLEQKEKNKKMVDDVITNIQQGAIDITANMKNQIERVLINHNKKRSEGVPDNTTDS